MTPQRKVPIAVFGQPVPDWYRDALATADGYDNAAEQHLDATYNTLKKLAGVSLADIDQRTAYALTTHYPMTQRAEAALDVIMMSELVKYHQHPNRKVVDRLGARLMEVVLSVPATALRFYTEVIQVPNRLGYGRLLGMKGAVAEEYLQYVALYCTVYQNQSFATYEDDANAVQHAG